MSTCELAQRALIREHTTYVALTTTELVRLAELEQVVAAGIATFVTVGNGLAEIRDSKLYRGSHSTFAAYVAERFGIGRSRAYQLISAAEMSTVVDITSERQARELIGLDTEVVKAVVKVATKVAENRGAQAPTAADLRDARIATIDANTEVMVSATTEEFEAALDAGRAEGNVSQTNIVRHLAAVPPKPSARRRRPLPDAYRDATEQTVRIVQTLARLHQDDRFTTNKSAIQHHGSHLARAANTLCDLLDDLGVDRHKYGGAL